MTAAQKIAKEKFKKAIAIRQKTGVSLKEAFAEVYGKKKVGAVKKKAAKKVVKKAAPKKAAKKVVKKAAKKVVQKTKPRYSAKKHKNWSIIPEHKRRVNGLPKKKKVSEQSILNKIHKVKNEVNSLDELQHKHMVGALSGISLNKINDELKEINILTDLLSGYERFKKDAPRGSRLKKYYDRHIKDIKEQIKEHKIHITQLKKQVK
jgi:hypothetical protein